MFYFELFLLRFSSFQSILLFYYVLCDRIYRIPDILPRIREILNESFSENFMPAKFRELLRHHTYSRLLAFSVRPTENATLSKAIIDNRCGAQLTIISTSGLHRLAKFGWTFGRVVFELCEWTDKQTDGQTNRHAHHNTSHSCRGEVTSTNFYETTTREFQ